MDPTTKLAEPLTRTLAHLNEARQHAAIDRLEVSPAEQRLDRLHVAHDNLYDALAALVEKLRPVLAIEPETVDDDQEPGKVDGSRLAQRLALETDQAEYLAAKVRAITAAVDL